MKKIFASFIFSIFILFTFASNLLLLPQTAKASTSAYLTPTMITNDTLSFNLEVDNPPSYHANYLLGYTKASSSCASYSCLATTTATRLPTSGTSTTEFYLSSIGALDSNTSYRIYTIYSDSSTTTAFLDGTGDPVTYTTEPDTYTSGGGGGGSGGGGTAPVVTVSNFAASSTGNGETINFFAKASSSVTATITYSFGCSTSSTGVPTQTTSMSVSVSTMTTISGSLTGLSPAVSSSHPYWCELLSSTGSVLPGATMSPITPPTFSGVPYAVPSTITSTSATIEIDFTTTSAPSSAPVITFSTDSSPLSGGTQVGMSRSGTNFTGNLTGLASSTTYYYSVTSPDQATVYGDLSQSFTSAPPPVHVATIVYTGTTSTVPGAAHFNVDGYGLVGCSGGWSVTPPTPGGPDASSTQNCGFQDLMDMINRLIEYVLLVIAPAICAVYLAWGGFQYATSGANPENRSKAKGAITNALVGWLLAASCFIIIKFVMQQLGYRDTVFPKFW